MNEHDSFSESIYQEQIATRRSRAIFIAAVTALYGRDQAELSAQNWLEESELMDSPPRSEECDWRAVTIAAAARLADRVNAKAASAESAKQMRN